MHTQSIKQISDGLQKKEFSSEEITTAFLKRAKELDPQINSYITLTEETAIAQAKAADQLIASGQAGPFTGVPVAHKDIFCTKGIRTSCGSKMLDTHKAIYDATIIQKFNAAGAVMLGKTNMDEFAMGSSNETSFYGDVKNPWDLERVPGGSSGGSAAVVAARLAPGSTGTDTGGSIRQPAAFAGITGLKPTYGRVSRFGMIAFASSLDQAGPMTHTAEDAAMMLQVMSGFDPNDSTSVDQPVPDFSADLNQSLQGLKIGLPAQFFGDDLDPDMAALVKTAADVLVSQGATLKSIDLNNVSLSVPVYYVVASAECSSNLSRYDGVRFGHRCDNPKDLFDLYTRSRAEGFGAEVKRRVLTGAYTLSAGYYDAYYLQAQKVRQLISQDFAEAFKDVDVILAPTTPSTAFKIGEKSNDPVSMYLSDIFTIAVNLAGLPGLSMPGGFIQGLPAGVQLIGRHFDEARILNVAHQYQQLTDWHQARPGSF